MLDEPLSALASALFKARHVDLGTTHPNQTDEDLHKFVKSHFVLRRIDAMNLSLPSLDIGYYCMSYICKFINESGSIVSLDLSNNGFGSDERACLLLASTLRHSQTLLHLDLSGCGFTSRCLAIILDAFVPSTGASSRPISAALQSSQQLSSSTSSTLFQRRSRSSSRPQTAFAASAMSRSRSTERPRTLGPANSSVVRIDLSSSVARRTQIGPESLDSLASVFEQNSNLMQISLRNTFVTVSRFAFSFSLWLAALLTRF